MENKGKTRKNELPVVLFVDDDERMLEAYSDRFALFGYNVLTASKPNDAIELTRTHAIDIAVLDIKMPEMDGFRLIKALRKLDPDLPVVFLSGKQDMDTTYRTFQLEANGFIEKPCLPQDLDFQLKRIINATKLRTAA